MNGNCCIYLKADNKLQNGNVRKVMAKVLQTSAYELSEKDGIFLLTLKAGQKGLSLLQNSFAAASEDLNVGFRGLIVPLFSESFVPFIDLVEEDHICYLFELGYTHHEVYADTLGLIDDIDVYTLMTVKAYIESGNSPSLASLSLYVHRNTVTYRIDRFIQETGIDLKSFPNAVYVYFLISLKLGEEGHLSP